MSAYGYSWIAKNDADVVRVLRSAAGAQERRDLAQRVDAWNRQRLAEKQQRLRLYREQCRQGRSCGASAALAQEVMAYRTSIRYWGKVLRAMA